MAKLIREIQTFVHDIGTCQAVLSLAESFEVLVLRTRRPLLLKIHAACKRDADASSEKHAILLYLTGWLCWLPAADFEPARFKVDAIFPMEDLPS